MDTMLLALSAEHSRRSMSIPSVVTDYEDRLEELSEAELAVAIEQVKTKTSMLQQENSMLESFLARTNKKILNGLQRQFDQKGKASVLASRRLLAATSSMLSSSGQLSHRSSDTLSSPVPSGFRSSSIFKIAAALDHVPRLNITQKYELVGQELEEVLAAVVRYRARYVRQQSCLVAEVENARLMLHELEETMAPYCTSTTDSQTSANNVIRQLEDSVKVTDFKTHRLQLRNSGLRQQRRLIQRQLSQDLELGSSMGPADLEELDITNKLYMARLTDQRTLLFTLRQMEGQYLIQENNGQHALKQRLMVLEGIEKQLCSRQAKLDKLTEQVRQLQAELASEERSYTLMKKLRDTYQIPDTMEYLKKKAEIDDLQRQLNTWQRKNRVQHATLKMNTQAFQRLMQAVKSQDKFGQSTSTARRCSLSMEAGDAPSRKSRMTMQDVVHMASNSRNKAVGIAVA